MAAQHTMQQFSLFFSTINKYM